MKGSAAAIELFVAKEAAEREELEALTKVAGQLLLEIEGGEGIEPFTIESDEDYQAACDLLDHVKRQLKDLEKRRLTVTKPLNDALTAFRGLYKPAEKYYEQVEARLKHWTWNYVDTKKRLEEAAMKQIAEAAKEGDFDKAMAVSQRIETAPVRKGMTFSEQWGYEVTDIEKVPEKYVVKYINRELLAAHVKGKATPKPISGIRFFKQPRVTVR